MPELSGQIVAPLVDVAINVAATLVGGAVSILAWVRWRETGGVGALYESGAFVVLTVTNGVVLGLVLIGRGDLFGFNPGEPEAASAYLWTSARLMAGALLVSGAVRGLRRTTPPNRPLAIALGPTIGLLVVVVAVLGGSARPTVPVPPVAPPLESPVIAVLQIAAFGLYLAAALLFRRLVRPGTPRVARVPRRRPRRGSLQPARTSR